MNELPDFLFPEGKQLRHRRKRVQSTESEAKKPKLEWTVCNKHASSAQAS